MLGACELVGLILLIAYLARTWPRVRGTTLTHVRGWAICAVAAIAAATLFPSDARKFAAWSLTFCPALSLLGAKRPQHIAWNFVVLSLWGVLILPVLESALLRPGAPIDLGELRPWFLLGLILLTTVSYFATRYAAAGVLLAVSQALFFARYLPFASLGPNLSFLKLGAVAVLFLAVVVAELRFHRRHADELHPLDVLWLDFRDSFGLFWSLRVAERVNAACESGKRPEHLEWEGFVVPPDHALGSALDAALAGGLRTTLRGLLRRFVDHAWLRTRRVDDGA